MRALRRNDFEPRIEMMPLIDVIFLLLTFFIYSMIVMLHAEVLPVSLVPLGTGERGTDVGAHFITIDGDGQLFLDREQVAGAELARRLSDLAADPAEPRLFVAVAAEGRVDRGPIVINLLEQVRTAGIANLEIVGQPLDQATGGATGAE